MNDRELYSRNTEEKRRNRKKPRRVGPGSLYTYSTTVSTVPSEMESSNGVISHAHHVSVNEFVLTQNMVEHRICLTKDLLPCMDLTALDFHCPYLSYSSRTSERAVDWNCFSQGAPSIPSSHVVS